MKDHDPSTPSAGHNPYSPPSSTELANPDQSWKTVEIASLVVRDGATLPRIDLETGNTDSSLVESLMKFRDTKNSWVNGLWGISYFVIRDVSESIEEHLGLPLTATLFAVGAVWIGILIGIGRARTRTIRFGWFIPSSLERRLRWFRVGHHVLSFSALVLIFASLLSPADSGHLDRLETPALVIGVILLIGSFLVRPLAPLEVRLNGHPDGVRINGISLSAMRRLREIEDTQGRATWKN